MTHHLLTLIEAHLQPTTTTYWRLLRQMDAVLLDLHKTRYARSEACGQGIPAGLLTYALGYPDHPLPLSHHLGLLATDREEATLALTLAMLADDDEAIFLLAYYTDLLNAAAGHLKLIAARVAGLELLDYPLAVPAGGDN